MTCYLYTWLVLLINCYFNFRCFAVTTDNLISTEWWLTFYLFLFRSDIFDAMFPSSAMPGSGQLCYYPPPTRLNISFNHNNVKIFIFLQPTWMMKDLTLSSLKFRKIFFFTFLISWLFYRRDHYTAGRWRRQLLYHWSGFYILFWPNPGFYIIDQVFIFYSGLTLAFYIIYFEILPACGWFNFVIVKHIFVQDNFKN